MVSITGHSHGRCLHLRRQRPRAAEPSRGRAGWYVTGWRRGRRYIPGGMTRARRRLGGRAARTTCAPVRSSTAPGNDSREVPLGSAGDGQQRRRLLSTWDAVPTADKVEEDGSEVAAATGSEGGSRFDLLACRRLRLGVRAQLWRVLLIGSEGTARSDSSRELDVLRCDRRLRKRRRRRPPAIAPTGRPLEPPPPRKAAARVVQTTSSLGVP